MNCSDKSVKHDRACGSPANAALVALGHHYCVTHGKRRNLLGADGKPTPLAMRADMADENGPTSVDHARVTARLKSIDAADPVRMGGATFVPTVSEALDLPAAPALEDEPSTEAPDIPAPAANAEGNAPEEDRGEYDRLSKLEAGIFGKTFGQNASSEAVDASAQPAGTVAQGDKATPGTAPATSAPIVGTVYSRQDTEELLAFLFNPIFKRTGKDALDEDELRLGGKAWQPAVNALLAHPQFPPYALAGLWTVTPLGGRYGGDVRARLTGRRARPTRDVTGSPADAGTPAPEARPTRQDAPATEELTEGGKPRASQW